MDRTVLHCDCNSYFASVELIKRPELRDKPVAVCGDPAARHGVILAKNETAKKYGVKTAETIISAQRKCPGLVLLKPHHELYEEYCRRINAIYGEYTDLVEPASVDESYMDVTGSLKLFGDGPHIADQLRDRVKSELGLTISIGVSFNKTFAKLGSDYKKPDATTVITRDNFQEILYPLPISDMMYVGKSSAQILRLAGIFTLGDIYNAGIGRIVELLGKSGEALWNNVAGFDNSPVKPQGAHEPVKSVGNSLTFRRDLVGQSDVAAGLTLLSDSVGERMRRAGIYGACVTVQIKDTELKVISRQMQLKIPTNSTAEIQKAAEKLVCRNWNLATPIRMLSVSVSELSQTPGARQLSFFDDDEQRSERDKKLYGAIDNIRSKFGAGALKMGNVVSTDIISQSQDDIDDD